MEAVAHACQEQEWADIIYLPGTRTFWLLTEEVSDILMEADDTLKGWVREVDVETRLQHLRDIGIMECLLAAEPISFLSQSDQQRYQELKNEKEKQETEIAEISRQTGQPGRAGTNALNERNRLRNLVNTLDSEILMLEAQGRSIAEENGYTLSGDHYYGPWEDEIATALENYRQCRHRVLEEYPSAESMHDELPIRDALSKTKEFLEECETTAPSSSTCPIWWPQIIDELSTIMLDYHDSILELATLGIATPEWALANIQGESVREELEAGAQVFDDYYALLKDSMELYEAVNEKLEEWESGTAGQAQLPVFLFEEERNQYEAIQNDLNALYVQAKRSVQESTPQRTLIWNTDLVDARPSLGYAKRKIDLLVRGDFPLREFSSPQAEKSLSHLSLWQLMPEMTPGERHQLDTALVADQVLPARLWEAPETALSQWLKSRCCQKIDLRPEWHDEQLGFFEPHIFFAYLTEQGLDVASLASESAKQHWGESLKKVLFTGRSREKLRLFDASAQAQMLRLVGMANFDLYEKTESGNAPQHTFELQKVSFMEATGDHGSSTKKSVSLSERNVALKHKWEAKGTFNLAKGEMSLGRLELPKKDEAQPIRVKLTEQEELTEQQNQEREVGRYAVIFDVVAKGFTGANVALANKVGFKLDKDGLSLSGLDLRNQETDSTGLTAFAGVKAGLEIGCSLDWKPPRNLQRLLPNWQALNELGMWEHNNRSLDDWRTLGAAAFEMEGRAGGGGNVDFVFGLRNGNFTFRIASKFVLGVGGGYKLNFELDGKNLDLWIAMLHRALVDNNYETPEWITEEAKNVLGKVGYILATTLLNVGLIAARGQAGIERLYSAMTGGQNAGPIAYVLATRDGEDLKKMKSWVQQLTPEALGALLYLLTSNPQEFETEVPGRGRSDGKVEPFNHQEALDFQQIAIANCLRWIVEGVTTGVYGTLCRFSREDPTPSQYLFAKGVIRMTENGQPPHDYPDTAYQNHKRELDDFMKRVSGTDNIQVPESKRDYSRDVAGLATEVCAV
ncbi:hypothetical protein [Halomonas sp. HL-93]|uniref:hypothetical protein n=1 Tax=Halomonas sp. HL-93 TaxID=1666906 RepID=UPI000942C6C1|nr:hypothetical protein [Halomonas sp. HL-93]